MKDPEECRTVAQRWLESESPYARDAAIAWALLAIAGELARLNRALKKGR